jgi:hypothetical protein
METRSKTRVPLSIEPQRHADHKLAFGELEANYWKDGVFAKPDYRYWAMYEFVHLSPSFRAVLAKVQRRKSPFPMPKDAAVVREVVKDFYLEVGNDTPTTKRLKKLMDDKYGRIDNDVEDVPLATDWWEVRGKHLFGIPAPAPSVRVFGPLTMSQAKLELEWFKSDSVVAQISLGQPLKEALKQLKLNLSKFNFSARNIQAQATKYTFADCPIRRPSLGMALEVLRWYQMDPRKFPVWWIGNHCGVTRTLSFTQEQEGRISAEELAYRKTRLHIATSRVLKTALLISENAARGRFPCIEPFPEAQLDAYRRKAGRPIRKKSM